LVLGDHTGMGGIREPFNELLQPVGVELEFDSAKPVSDTWRDGLVLFPSRIALGMSGGEPIPLGVGASLRVRAPARVVLAGVPAFADRGDEEQSERGFLGDFRHEPGEPLGDLALAASARVGAGRVLVFGDTSPFQNGSLGEGPLFVDNCLRWLTGDERVAGLRARAARIASALVLLAALCFGLARARILALTVLALLPWTASRPWDAGEPLDRELPGAWSPAVVDSGHGQAFDGMWWRDDSIGGLHQNLLRNGLWVDTTREAARRLGEGGLLVMLPPTVRLSRSELEELEGFVRGGGVLLATVGADAGEAALELVRWFGFEVAPSPLGPAQCDALGGRMELVSAYPVAGAPAGFVSMARVFDQDVAGWARLGRGALVLIADSRFLLNPNLEGGEAHVVENVEFLRSLVELLREEDLL
jgi:hypothetical protein